MRYLQFIVFLITSIAANAADIQLDHNQLKVLRSQIQKSYTEGRYQSLIPQAKTYLVDARDDVEIRYTLARSYYHLKDFNNAARELQNNIVLSEKTNTAPSEQELLLLQSCYQKLNDFNANIWNYEKLVTYYPKNIYWYELLTGLSVRSDFRAGLSLDLYRLRYLTDTLKSHDDYLEAITLALQSGFPIEAKKFMDQGLQRKLLNVSAPSISKLKDEVSQKAAEERLLLRADLTDILAKHSNYNWSELEVGVAQVMAGMYQEGIKNAQNGLNSKVYKIRPQVAKLRLAEAYYYANMIQLSQQNFEMVTGHHGAANLAKLWYIYLKQN